MLEILAQSLMVALPLRRTPRRPEARAMHDLPEALTLDRRALRHIPEWERR